MMPEELAQTMLTRVLGQIPMGGMGEPVDIANGCLFLASDESNLEIGVRIFSNLVVDYLQD
jgi:NAD(P)-dependent dehydrogenase (short-subunit alcohol dehydrogenase family)